MKTNTANNFELVRCPVVGIPAINESLNQDGFYISYCWRTADYGCVTTALVLEKPSLKFLILCGDHRKTYQLICSEPISTEEKRAKCLEYFADNISDKHKYSNNI